MSSVRARRGEEIPGWLRGAPAPRWARALPLVLLAVLAVADFFSDLAELDHVLAVLPALAAVSFGPLGTGLLSLAVLGLVHPYTPGWQGDPGATVSFVVAALLGVGFAWMRSRRDAQLVSVSTVADAAQLAVLPPLPERVGRVRCVGLYRAAQQGALVSGDLYDVRSGPWGVRAVVADVEGHDLSAVSTVTALLGAFREAVLDDADLAQVAARMDRRLVVDSAADEHAELFATAVLMEFPSGEQEVRVVSCGHPPPLLLRTGEASELRLDPAPPLGLGLAGLGAPTVTVVPLLPGDRLLAHTDGVTEARDAQGDFYPLARRLPGLAASADGPGALTEAILADLARFTGAAKSAWNPRNPGNPRNAKRAKKGADGSGADDVALLLLEPDGH
ncbi:PP2C family protein-serine/threonine phosphatase [Streptomyces sp. NPDC051561]|uniref:PP2C family protein-serine/threonine phosphatase n=1 Tax=Streptomyces sp. NPDC051561 TaxID=3365658 RepID=UPI0037884F92